jgi:hypothetical protein
MAPFDSALKFEIYPGRSEIALPFTAPEEMDAAYGTHGPQDFDGGNVAQEA